MGDGAVTAHIYDKSGERLVRKEQRVPVCGQDFCDACGDCLDCYWDDPCPKYGEHFWVIYGEDD